MDHQNKPFIGKVYLKCNSMSNLGVRNGDKSLSRSFISTCIADFDPLCADPQDVRYPENGKPFIPTLHGSFNLSHSSRLLALYAHAGEGSCGCDVQVVRKKYDQRALSERAYTKEEREWMASLEDGFFILWTMKEAAIKQKGGSIWDLSSQEILPCLSSFSLYRLSFGPERYYLALTPSSVPVFESPEEISIQAIPLQRDRR